MNFEHCEPILRVEDMRAALAFYVGILGFQNAPWGNDDFTCVTHDRAAIYLCRGDQGRGGAWVWVAADDVEALYPELVARGANVIMPPTSFSWAMEIRVQDPSGNVLRFGSEPKPAELPGVKAV